MSVSGPRVSIAVAHWNRGAALERMLRNLAELYGGTPGFLEVSICDDGSGRRGESAREAIDRAAVADLLSLRLSILPAHEEPRCPALAINVAVESSTAPVVVIQGGPEVTHRGAEVLHGIETELLVEPDAFVVAACWESDLGTWYQHSKEHPYCLHWTVGISRNLWRRTGGIDLGLMAGHGYDDNDLRNRIIRAGGRIHERDDLVVEHRKSLQEKVVGRRGVEDFWDGSLTAVNRARYHEQWGDFWPKRGRPGE